MMDIKVNQQVWPKDFLMKKPEQVQQRQAKRQSASNKELTQELHKPGIKKLKKREVYTN